MRAAAAAGYARAVVVERGAAASRESVAGVVAALRAGAAVAVPAAVNTRAAPRAAPVRGASLIADILELQPAAAVGVVGPVPTMSSCVCAGTRDGSKCVSLAVAALRSHSLCCCAAAASASGATFEVRMLSIVASAASSSHVAYVESLRRAYSRSASSDRHRSIERIWGCDAPDASSAHAR